MWQWRWETSRSTGSRSQAKTGCVQSRQSSSTPSVNSNTNLRTAFVVLTARCGDSCRAISCHSVHRAYRGDRGGGEGARQSVEAPGGAMRFSRVTGSTYESPPVILSS